MPTAARSPLPVVVFAGALSVLKTHFYYPLLLLAWCCSGVVAVCAYRIAARASGREWIGLWTGVVFACYLSEMFITTTYSMASEPLFAACLAVYVLLLIRAADRPGLGIALAAGVMLGLTALSRPTVLWLPVVSVAWLLFELRAGVWRVRRERGLAMATAFVLAFAAVQVPWVVRNYRVFGDPIVTTTLGGFNLYRHNGMIEEGKYHTGYSHPEMERRIRQLAAATGRPLESFNEAELNTLLKAEGARIIRTYPLRYVKLSAMRTVWIWYNENSGRGLYAVQNFLIYLLALGGFFYAAALARADVLPAARPYRVLRRVPQRDQRAVPVHLPDHALHDSAGRLPVYAVVAEARAPAARRLRPAGAWPRAHVGLPSVAGTPLRQASGRKQLRRR